MIGVIPAIIFVGEFSGTTTNAVTSTALNDAVLTTVPRLFIVHIKPAAFCVGSSVSNAGLTVSSLPTGSRCIIVNNGGVYGKGGVGGRGGTAIATSTVNPASNGSAGGLAMSLSMDVIIDNVNGQIFGGGGGGGGGASIIIPQLGIRDGLGGGGGGGGQTHASVSGGAKGTDLGFSRNNSDGIAGGSGLFTGGGNGGGGGSIQFDTERGGFGGNAGDWGAAGLNGNLGSGTGTSPATHGAIGTGAIGGLSVKLNSNEITWVSGDGAANVKGSIS